MPYPSQTDRETIINTAYDLIESEGVERLSLARLAQALGLKAPSLYRHVANKTALLQAVNTLTFEKLYKAYTKAVAESAGATFADLEAVFQAHRAFAHAHPQSYMLAFSATEPGQRVDETILEQMALTIQNLMAEISGREKSLAALRGGLALAHGFVMLELMEQFKRGGDLDEAFALSIKAYLTGWQKTADQ